MINAYTIRPYQPGDENNCLELYNYVFPQSMTLHHWQWLNDKNPAGISIIETAWDNSRLMGFYGLIPMTFYAAGEIVKGALSGITVTHPDYRYREVFSNLGKEVYKRAEISGIGLIYGFPTEHSRHGFKKKLDWNFIQQGCLLTGSGEIISGYRTSPLKIRKKERFDQEMDFIWNRLAEGTLRTSILVVRNREYLSWRFQSYPSRGYSIIVAEDKLGPSGYLVFRQSVINGEKYCHVDDVVAVDINSFRNMIRHLTELFEGTFFYQIRLWENSPFYRSAIGMGFRESSIKYFFGIKTMKKNLINQDQQWYLTMADSPEIPLEQPDTNLANLT